MLRPRAVRALLVEEVAGLRRAKPAGESAAGEPEADERRDQERELRRAARRALGVALACVAAVAALFALRDPARAWLAPGRGDGGGVHDRDPAGRRLRRIPPRAVPPPAHPGAPPPRAGRARGVTAAAGIVPAS